MVARRGLSQSSVLAEAEELVEHSGWRQLTMTALATRLGVRTPSLYNHVGGLDDLLGQIQCRAFAELSDQLGRAAIGRTGADGLRALAAVLHDFAHAHPGRYELAMSKPFDAHALGEAGAMADLAMSAIIASFGITDDPAELRLTCLATLHGVLALERTGLYTGGVDADAVYAHAVELVVLLLQNAGGKA